MMTESNLRLACPAEIDVNRSGGISWLGGFRSVLLF